MKVLFLTAGLAIASPGFADHQLAAEADGISRFLATDPDLSQRDRRDVQDYIDRISWVLETYGYDRQQTSPFRLEQVDDQLRIYARDTGTLLYRWNKHDSVEVRGAVIALLDAGGEFAALRYENGTKTVLVERWRDTVDFEVQYDYIGLVDSKGITDLYSTHEAKALVSNWRNTAKHAFEPEFAVLLDNEREKNLAVYDVKGKRIVAIKGVTDFEVLRPYQLRYVQDNTERVLDLSDYLH